MGHRRARPLESLDWRSGDLHQASNVSTTGTDLHCPGSHQSRLSLSGIRSEPSRLSAPPHARVGRLPQCRGARAAGCPRTWRAGSDTSGPQAGKCGYATLSEVVRRRPCPRCTILCPSAPPGYPKVRLWIQEAFSHGRNISDGGCGSQRRVLVSSALGEPSLRGLVSAACVDGRGASRSPRVLRQLEVVSLA